MPLMSFMSKANPEASDAADGTVDDFFTGDDGRSVLNVNIQTSTIRSVDSLATIAEGGTLSMHLRILCDYIGEHKSLSSATILSASSYTQRSKVGVKHRFLLLHLQRSRKTDVWLRLDRLRSNELTLGDFLLAGGEVGANDVASVSKDKQQLIGRASWENTQIYNIPPLLGDFRHFLLIIVSELVTYKVGSDNCWMFSSTLQQHLGEIGQGQYTHGKLHHPNLSPDVRLRVRRRVLSEFPVLFYARANRAYTPETDYELGYKISDILTIIRVNDQDWWLGIHLVEAKREPGRFLLRSRDMDRVPALRPQENAPILFYARALTQAAGTGWDLSYGIGDVICVTEELGDTGICVGFNHDNAVAQPMGHLVEKLYMFQMATRAARPHSEFIDDATPVLYYARARVSHVLVGERDLDYNAGDIISVIALNNFKEPVLGVLWDETRRRPGRCVVRPADLFRIPTREEQPTLDFLDDITPVIYYARALTSNSRSEDNVLDYRPGDIIAVITTDEDNEAYFGVFLDERRHRPGCYFVDSNDLFRIPTKEEQPGLYFLDKYTPYLYYARALASAESPDTYDLRYSKDDIIAIIAEDKRRTPILGLLPQRPRRSGSHRLAVASGHMLQLPVPTPPERPDLEFTEDGLPIYGFARAMYASSRGHDAVHSRLGDAIAIIELDHKQQPVLGVLWDKERHVPGQHQVKWDTLSRIPTRKERPDLEFLDEVTPVLFYARAVEDTRDEYIADSPYWNETFLPFRAGQIIAVLAEKTWAGLDLRRCLGMHPSDLSRRMGHFELGSVVRISAVEAHESVVFEVLK